MNREETINEILDFIHDEHIYEIDDLLRVLSDDLIKQLYIFFELNF